jgi:hypothetical protein
VFERAADRLRMTVLCNSDPGDPRAVPRRQGRDRPRGAGHTVGGKPVAQAWVFVDAGNQRIHCPTDEDGRFRFEALPSGPCPLFVNLGVLETGKAYLTRTVTVDEGRMTRLALDLSLEVHGTLTVRRLTAPWSAPGTGRSSPAAWVSPPTRRTGRPRPARCRTLILTLRLPGTGPWTLDLDEQGLILDGVRCRSTSRARARAAARPPRGTVDPLDGRIEIEIRDAGDGEVVRRGLREYAWRQTRGAASSEGTAPVVREGRPRHPSLRVRGSRRSARRSRSRSRRSSATSERRSSCRAPTRSGLTSVEPGSPAEAAGLRADDRILRYGDTRVRNVTELAAALQATAPTDLVPRDPPGGPRRPMTARRAHGVRIENTRTSGEGARGCRRPAPRPRKFTHRRPSPTGGLGGPQARGPGPLLVGCQRESQPPRRSALRLHDGLVGTCVESGEVHHRATRRVPAAVQMEDAVR